MVHISFAENLFLHPSYLPEKETHLTKVIKVVVIATVKKGFKLRAQMADLEKQTRNQRTYSQQQTGKVPNVIGIPIPKCYFYKKNIQ